MPDGALPEEEDEPPDDPVHYVHAAPNHTVSEEEFIGRFGRPRLSLLTPNPLKYKAAEGLVSLSFNEIRIQISGTDKTGVAHLGVYDCGYSNPMKTEYAVTGGTEIILTLDGGEFEVVENDKE